MTTSAEWDNFGYNRVVNILKSGSWIKTGYCLAMSFLILSTGHSKCSLVLLFTIIFEYSLNCTPIRNGNDNDLIHNIEKFYGEKDYVDRHRKALEKFHKVRIAVWGILWQIIIIVLSVVILYLLYETPFDVIEVLENFIMDYCYGRLR